MGVAGLFLLLLPMSAVAAHPPVLPAPSSSEGFQADSANKEDGFGRDRSELQHHVSRLLVQLDADSREERADAARELIDLGPRILPLLPAPSDLPKASVREAVRQIRRQLEHRKARESVLPSRVTLQDSLPLESILEQVSRQTGNPLDFADLPAEILQQSLAVNYRNDPFWVVLDDLAKRARLQFQPDAESGELALTRRSPANKRRESAVAHSSAFRVAVRSAELRPLFGDDAHKLLRLQCTLLAEPRLRPLFLQFSGTDVSAETADNRDVEPYNPQARYEFPLAERGDGVTFRADFKVPATRKLSEVDVRGKVILQTAADEEKFVFDLSKAHGEGRRRGGVNVTLQNVEFETVTKQEHHAQVRLAVGYDTGGPAFESHRTWVFHNRVYLETDNAEPIEPSGPFTTLLQADGSIAVEYPFKHLKERLDRYRFVYFAPTLIIKVPVEFTFEKIPVKG